MKVVRQNHCTAASSGLGWPSVLFFICALTCISSTAIAGDFAVSPIRLDFDNTSKSGSLTITNSAESELKVQISLYEWSEDGDGADAYRASDDLLYFPRLATIAPNSQQVIRVGLRGTTVNTYEKSYRLFVEELPEKKPLTGTQLAIAIRFSVPLFVRPPKEDPRGEIDSLRMEKGQLHVVVRNTGNVHLMVSSIAATSGALFNAEVNGWYLLPGAKREYQLAVPAEICAKLKKLDVRVKTDRLQFEKSLDITASMCSSK